MINRVLSIIKLFKNLLIQPRKQKGSTYAYDKFREDELNSSYNYFKKFFYNAIFLKRNDLRKYAIKKAIELDTKQNSLFLEFGVYKGESTNYFSKFLKSKLYAFDSFKGLEEDWLGFHHAAGDFGGIEIPKLNKNVELVVGNVKDTLSKFISKNKDSKINFIHMDIDNFTATKFILEMLKPQLNDKAIIVFDEYYNFQGWKFGEFKAFSELFSENEFNYKCFSADGEQVVIEYNKLLNNEI
tara:strand:- start:1499 stop:2221 length:723 start_codon:yes stop_codon:yes gene_type:complete